MSDRLRIAVYYNVGWGGGRRWLYECVSRLAKLHDVDLYSIDRNSIGVQHPDVNELGQHAEIVTFSDLPRFPGVLRPLNVPLVWIDLWRFAQASRVVADRIDARKYDVLFASIGGYTEAPMVLRHTKTLSAYYCHEPMRNVYEPKVRRPYNSNSLTTLPRRLWNRAYWGGLIRRWDRQGTRGASLVIANSKYTADYANRAYAVSPEVNYPGVDVEAFRPAERPRERFVLMVGELVSSKGVDWAVRAIATIPAGHRPPIVLVCNRVYAPERHYVETIAKDCGVELIIRERVPDAEVKRLFQTASAMLYTPHLEPFGLVALEAMASGTPVVAVREAGPIETVVDGETGFLCERDPQQLGDAVLRLMDDELLRARMSKAGREHVMAHWTWERSVERLDGLLRALVERHRADPGMSAKEGIGGIAAGG
ncbi:MAG: glycosyltransferase family 4 protein [Dehalococcoidia bacterium]